MPPSSETVSVAGSGLTFVNTYDASVSSAYQAAIVKAEQELEYHFSDPVTIHASFSLASLGAGVAAQNAFSTMDVDYASLVSALHAHATTALDAEAVGGLPASDPSQGAGFALAVPQAVMLGLASAGTAGEVHVTLNSDLPWSFGQDAVGAIEHELTEGGFGRIGSLGHDGPEWGVMDLFRYTAAGYHDYTGGSDGQPTYFGADGAHLEGWAFHNSVDASGAFDGADLADWNSTTGDAFGPGGPGAPGYLSPVDLHVLDAIGWTPNPGYVPGQTLSVSPGHLQLEGGGGADTLTGWAFGDRLFGEAGDDSIQGGASFDQVNGNTGQDTIDGGVGGNDWLLGGQGNDLIRAHAGNVLINGNLGNDTVLGGAWNDTLHGGQGDDSLSGGTGQDFITGDLGNDTLVGGGDADIFHGFVGTGHDVVVDFHASEGDRVELDAGTPYSVAQVGADVVISIGTSDQMVLQNTTLSTLPQGWIFSL